ncbi:hypothetical protein Pst134EA_013035 [Puccinia striiformis f. sp. tritici]|uniref:hypothetical protein n=1 Tax=Puccinia striiformis f. sp. tritici TaxID=168172 RepID=UPI0020078760|nr:hypothetical protein Pst134EA_013035 [Puccinia striiformis f. sp. tritici]KAH9465142.1 hypothetical protein Pst134EA_013035 [Puccinia striiformis f. sp. tritici]
MDTRHRRRAVYQSAGPAITLQPPSPRRNLNRTASEIPTPQDLTLLTPSPRKKRNKTAPKISTPAGPTLLAPSRSSRRQGMVIPSDALPQEIQNLGGANPAPTPASASTPSTSQLRASRRQGMVLDAKDLPQEVKDLKRPTCPHGLPNTSSTALGNCFLKMLKTSSALELVALNFLEHLKTFPLIPLTTADSLPALTSRSLVP